MKVGYASLSLDLFSSTRLLAALNEFLDLDNLLHPNNLHATLMYDQSGKFLVNKPVNRVYCADITGVKVLGEAGSKYYACVLTLESEDVQKRFKELISEGFKHSYDELLLHVSLTYGDSTNEVYRIVKDNFDKLPKTINLCNETWELT